MPGRRIAWGVQCRPHATVLGATVIWALRELTVSSCPPPTKLAPGKTTKSGGANLAPNWRQSGVNLASIWRHPAEQRGSRDYPASGECHFGSETSRVFANPHPSKGEKKDEYSSENAPFFPAKANDETNLLPTRRGSIPCSGLVLRGALPTNKSLD